MALLGIDGHSTERYGIGEVVLGMFGSVPYRNGEVRRAVVLNCEGLDEQHAARTGTALVKQWTEKQWQGKASRHSARA